MHTMREDETANTGALSKETLTGTLLSSIWPFSNIIIIKVIKNN